MVEYLQLNQLRRLFIKMVKRSVNGRSIFSADVTSNKLVVSLNRDEEKNLNEELKNTLGETKTD